MLYAPRFGNAFLGYALTTPFYYACAKEEKASSEDKALISTLLESKRKSLKISHSIQWKFSKTPFLAQALLSNSLIIDLPPDPIDQKALPFFIAHELAHLKYNNPITNPIIAYLVTVITHIACKSLGRYSGKVFHTLFYLSWLSLAVGCVSLILLSRYCTTRADKLALTVLTKEEKQGALAFFQHLQQLDIDAIPNPKDKRSIKKIIFSNIAQPPLASRIRRLEQSIEAHM